MANVANTKATGPVSKDAISGGKKFPVKERQPRSTGLPASTNGTAQAHSAIMGLKYKAGAIGGKPDKSFFSKPSK